MRVSQIDVFRENALILSKNTMAAKFCNSVQTIKRTLHDVSDLRNNSELQAAVAVLSKGVENLTAANSIEQILGIEGNCAQAYFSVFDKLITRQNSDIHFSYRNKRPPLDEANALLSFIYTLYTAEFAAALETVGLDSYIGFCHALRSGRHSLACDLVEEARCLADRFALTLINLQIVRKKDFDTQISGAVWLNDNGRKKVLSKWQEKKRTEYLHPYLKQKIPFGLIPYVQSNLLAKYVRGEIEEYPCFLLK